MLSLVVVRFILLDKYTTTKASEDVATVVSDFLVQDIPLDWACANSSTGSLQWLEFIWKRGLQNVQTNQWMVAKLLHTEPHYYQWAFSRAMVQAVRQDDLKMVQWLLDHFREGQVNTKVLKEAADCGCLQILELLEADPTYTRILWDKVRLYKSPLEMFDVIWCNNLLEVAANRRHWEVMWWFDARVSTPETRRENVGVVNAALTQNNLQTLRSLVRAGFGVCLLDFPDCADEDWHTRVDIVRYLMEIWSNADDIREISYYTLNHAAWVGDLQFMKWLVARVGGNYVELPFLETLKIASEHGHLPVVEWLLSDKIGIVLSNGPTTAMFAAVRGGNLDVVKWLFERFGRDPNIDIYQKRDAFSVTMSNGIPATAMDNAAESGHLEVLQFLHRIDLSLREKRKQCDGDTVIQDGSHPRCTSKAMDRAATNGHLEVVQWLHSNRSEGCIISAMNKAGPRYYFELSVPPHENPNARCRHKAVISPRDEKCFAVLQWLHAKRPEGCTSKLDSTMIDNAAANGHLEILQWLHDNTETCCTTRAMDDVAARGWLDVVKWLHVNRSEGCMVKAMTGAAENGHLDVVKWLQKNGCEGDIKEAVEAASMRGHLNVVRWLLAVYKGVDTLLAMRMAVLSGHFEVALFLHSQHGIDLSDAEVAAEVAAWKSELKSRQRHSNHRTIFRAWLEEIFL